MWSLQKESCEKSALNTNWALYGEWGIDARSIELNGETPFKPL